MSWLSKTVDKARNFTDKVAKDITDPLPGGLRKYSRRAFRYGTASMAGGMGLQYEYSRNKGMNSDEATKNATTGGAQYSTAREMQKARVAEEAAQVQAAALERNRIAEEARARGQIAARIRRGNRDPQSRQGTIATSAGGLGTTGNWSAFASLLGL